MIGVVVPCKWGVSQLNVGGYSLWGGWRCHIHSLRDAYLISQNCQKKKMNSGRTTRYSISSLNLSDTSSKLNPKIKVLITDLTNFNMILGLLMSLIAPVMTF